MLKSRPLISSYNKETACHNPTILQTINNCLYYVMCISVICPAVNACCMTLKFPSVFLGVFSLVSQGAH